MGETGERYDVEASFYDVLCDYTEEFRCIKNMQEKPKDLCLNADVGPEGLLFR
ncbi:MAG: hypothetical protein ACE5OV_04455 [Candidatus Bathyarchaeia archaeon]